MTIEEAVKELNTLELPIETEQDHRKHLAIRLGIEAIKEIKRCRDNGYRFICIRLPEETIEQG
jgi:hypothetical protein